MGQILVEGHLEFDFRTAIVSTRFDADEVNDLSHCMKRVDFIVETANQLFFIEVKDLDNPHAQPQNVNKFLQELHSDALIANKLVPKARDSFLFNHLTNGLPEGKARIYVVLIACGQLQTPELSTLTDKLKTYLPLVGPFKQAWPQPYFDSCFITNFSGWNRIFQQFPVTRNP